jgi:hypothetical protein
MSVFVSINDIGQKTAWIRSLYRLVQEVKEGYGDTAMGVRPRYPLGIFNKKWKRDDRQGGI